MVAEGIVRPVAARPVVSYPAQTEVARPDVPAGLHREHLKAPARPSAAAARKVRALPATEEAEAMVAQRLAQAERLARPAAEAQAVREAQQAPGVVEAQPRAAPEVRDAAVAPQPAAEPAGAVLRLEVAAVRDVAAAPRRVAGLASVAARRRAVGPAAEAVRPRVAGVRDAGGLRPGARGAQAVLLLAAAWAALPSTRLQGDRLAPSARVARARRQVRTARP
jgi:hypothetical protein